MNNFSIIVEARHNSKRLPGKVMLRVKKKPILWHLVRRLKKCKQINKIIIATSVSQMDNEIEKFAKNNNLMFFRGSENNVTQRVYEAAKKNKLKNIVRITGDCPLVDPNMIDHYVELFKKNKFDFLTNSHYRSYPDGMDIEIFKFDALKKAMKLIKSKKDKEHTTYILRKYPKIFKTFHYISPRNTFYPTLGLTLDEKNDFKLIKIILEYFYRVKNFTCLDIINFLKKNKNYLQINRTVKRNSYKVLN